jgi:formamidopyrimidine-DNA glycosylase
LLVPELPEVETIRRQLKPVTEGKTIARVAVADPRWCEPHATREFAARLRARTIERFDRRGKFLLLRLGDSSTLALHLRMTGNLLYLSAGEEVPAAHLRGTLHLDDGVRLAFVDPRRFGTARVYGDDELAAYLEGRIGVEPFGEEFTPGFLHAATRRRRTPIKALLLDQRHVAGIGNIYADEALYRAKLSPRMRADRLTRVQASALHAAIRDALTAGIDAKGASIDDFRDAYGVQGSFQDAFLVHRREGLPCPGCETPVRKVRVGGRGTYYCPACQRS